ncbi:DUF3592 domain-containing protein [Calothrix sp. FACHB-1219]|uniref:DUF3592 domain-containing protein n=1 Tax=unclassified Calothrix TaxID=2619626 RepID=UPI001682C320|nr:MULTISPECIES: DUF3592 domain-containing protein [unclassified Calothrix]MBD2205796.1 DUF3592 domain-containing protein [Calothrix sp. FACHB-168]MBD2220625.1 DUF3592 domain-containing protein [Calothrix sp. FACHB-1219]
MNIKIRQVTFEDKWSGTYLVLFGLLMIGGGFYVNHQITYERAHFIETQGTVVDNAHYRERDSKNQQKDTYAPIIEFSAKGDRVQFTGHRDSSKVIKGKIVVVRYDPKQPAKTAREVRSLESLVPWFVFGMGGLSLVSGMRQLSPISLSLSKSTVNHQH